MAVPRVEILASSGLSAILAEFERPESKCDSLGDALQEAKKVSDGPDIPVVDVGGSEKGGETLLRCVEAVREAAEEWGVMHIVNHGIPEEVIERLRAAGRGFFELPVEEKEKYAND